VRVKGESVNLPEITRSQNNPNPPASVDKLR